MSEDTKTDIEKNGAEDSEDSGAEKTQDEETGKDASAELAALKKKNGYLRRQLADVANYKRELGKENQVKLDRKKKQISEDLRPVLNSFKKAVEDFGKPTKRQKDILEGVQIMEKQVRTVLEELGVTEL